MSSRSSDLWPVYCASPTVFVMNNREARLPENSVNCCGRRKRKLETSGSNFGFGRSRRKKVMILKEIR